MFKQIKLKLAARRVDKAKKTAPRAKKPATTKPVGFWAKLWAIISWPIRVIGRALTAFWQWVRCLDLIGLINLTLLVAIIVLFSMLILDLVGCRKRTVVVVAAEPVQTATAQKITEKPNTSIKVAEKTDNVKVYESKVAHEKITLPLKKKATSCQSDKIAAVRSGNPVMHGTIIIDGELPGEKLSYGVRVNGNVYLQNMRRYTLPCNVYIDGDLYLRNVGMLKFCGGFTVTGNIYVTPNSSFGPIPGTARLGGQVIL